MMMMCGECSASLCLGFFSIESFRDFFQDFGKACVLGQFLSQSDVL